MEERERAELLKKWERFYQRMVKGSIPLADARKFTLEMLDISVTVALLEEAAPRVCEAFWQALPVESFVLHARWSGDMVFLVDQVQLGVKELENPLRFVRPGDVCYCPQFDELSICYGVADARLPTGSHVLSVFGRITDGLDQFARFCTRIPILGAQPISIERAQ
jgi:hypothetical protein